MKILPYILLIISTILSGLLVFGKLNNYYLVNGVVILTILTFYFLPKRSEFKLNKKIIMPLAFIIITIARLASMNAAYDSGIYYDAIQQYNAGTLENNWIEANYGPGLFMLTSFVGFLPIENYLPIIYLILELLLITVIYKTLTKYFNNNVALISILFYTFSIVQFNAYSALLMKNLLGLILLFIALYFYKKNNKLFVLSAILLSITHKPSFLIFGIGYFIHSIINWKDKYSVKLGIIIVLFTTILYLNRIDFLLEFFRPIIAGASISGGQFISFNLYKILFVGMLPFVAIGTYKYIDKYKKTDKTNILLYMMMSTLIIVFLKLIFFNRFIIHLDLLLIIFASIGIYELWNPRYKIFLTVSAIAALSIGGGLIVTNQVSGNISNSEIQYFKELQLPTGANLMVVSSQYATSALYSDYKVVSPGLFNDKMVKAEWEEFWKTNDVETFKDYMNRYEKPLYVFIGEKDNMNISKFKECLNQNEKVFEYTC